MTSFYCTQQINPFVLASIQQKHSYACIFIALFNPHTYIYIKHTHTLLITILFLANQTTQIHPTYLFFGFSHPISPTKQQDRFNLSITVKTVFLIKSRLPPSQNKTNNPLINIMLCFIKINNHYLDRKH